MHSSAIPVALAAAKEPGAQPQVLEPWGEMALAGHERQLDEPAEEKELAAQGTHVAIEIADVAVEYEPAGHCVQLEAPAAEYVPAGQGTQLVRESVVFLKEPGAHCVHTPEPEKDAE